METQLKPRPTRVVDKPKSTILYLGDRVEVAGPSKHQGVIIDIKISAYSGFTCSVRVGSKRLDRIDPSALRKLC